MLRTCKDFFDDLDEHGVRYCHWKSNEHLDDAVDGKTDLDILIKIDDKKLFQAAVNRFDFKCILSPPDKQFPSLEDYLGFDVESGRLIHLHVHYHLILGQKYIKNHHLPIESLFFDNLIQKRGVCIPCPELELIILIIRAHMKAGYWSLAKQAIKNMLGAKYTAFPVNIEIEFRKLYQASDAKKFSTILKESGLPLGERQCIVFLNRLVAHKLRFYHILLGHFQILHDFRGYRRDTSINVLLSYISRSALNLSLVKRVLAPKRKTLPGLGRDFSIVGADGSGKSTLIKDLEEWLSWKLAVKSYYYGIPKDAYRAIRTFLTRLFRKMGLSSLQSVLDNLFWLHVARYRKNVSDKVARDVAKGRLVLTDRFPLREFRRMDEPMDNPRIDVAKIWLGRNLSEWEKNFYNQIHNPDRVFVLQVDISELRKRKTDLPLHTHQQKVAAVNNIKGADNVILINANVPYDDVLLQVKREIWQAI